MAAARINAARFTVRASGSSERERRLPRSSHRVALWRVPFSDSRAGIVPLTFRSEVACKTCVAGFRVLRGFDAAGKAHLATPTSNLCADYRSFVTGNFRSTGTPALTDKGRRAEVLCALWSAHALVTCKPGKWCLPASESVLRDAGWQDFW